LRSTRATYAAVRSGFSRFNAAASTSGRIGRQLPRTSDEGAILPFLGLDNLSAPTGTPRRPGLLAPSVSELTMYTTVWCGQCRRLKVQLVRAGISFREVDIEQDAAAAAFVAGVNGGNQTVPTMLLPDGSVLTHPTIGQITEAVAA
jgi:mycoredoxin